MKQCAAIRPDGRQCKRVAREGSNYCHSHRDHKSRTPTVEERRAEHLFPCSDCGHLIRPGQSMVIQSQPLCEPCYRLRCQIEERILEAIRAAPDQMLTKDQIHEDLERFGVDKDLAEAARLRMHEDGRLVSA